MNQDAVAFLPATELAAMIRRRRLGCRELLELYLARIEKINPVVNAVIAMDTGRARAEADAADRALAQGDAVGPLHGVPMTVKDSFDVAGLPTTWGSPAHAGNVAGKSATAVERLERAGAIVFGKTNVPLMLADWQSFNAIHGATRNPWDLERSPGGSSGGSAAALAAGLTGLEFGSDIGGSLRVPAHFCGVYSHKPTYGIVPSAGHALGPGARTDVSVCGPMARSAGDLALAMSVVAGAEGDDAKAWKLALPGCPKTRLREFRIAVMLDSACAEVDTSVRSKIEALCAFLEAEGAQVDLQARPAIDMAQLARDGVALIRGAQSGKLPSHDYDMQLARRAALPPEDDGHVARHVRSLTLSHREWLQANDRRHAMQQAWKNFFSDWDVLLCPAASTPAFVHEHRLSRLDQTSFINGRPRPLIEQVFWAALAGISYLPATVAPIGRTAGNLPVGIQIVGPRYGDATCMALAALLEARYESFSTPPMVS